MSLWQVGTKPGGGGEEQPYDDHGRYLGTLYATNGRAKTATEAGGRTTQKSAGQG